MKQQYLADINDYRKFALLRRLLKDPKTTVGIVWMLTPADGRNDGQRTQYLKQPNNWRHYDPGLFDALIPIARDEGVRQLQLVEKSGIIPNAAFFDEHVPVSPSIRGSYMSEALSRFKKSTLIFFDPDNGLHVSSVATGAPASPKYVYRSEVLAAYERGHSVLIYQHFPREDHSQFRTRAMRELGRLCHRGEVWCFETADVAFLLVVHAQHRETIGNGARSATNGWDNTFMVAHGPSEVDEQES